MGAGGRRRGGDRCGASGARRSEGQFLLLSRIEGRGCDDNLNGGLLVAGAVAILAGAIVAVVGALPIHAGLTAGPGAVMITGRVTF